MSKFRSWLILLVVLVAAALLKPGLLRQVPAAGPAGQAVVTSSLAEGRHTQAPRAAKRVKLSPTPVRAVTATPRPQATAAADRAQVEEDGVYQDKEHVAQYLVTYGKLPKNYITKSQARALGWQGGDLRPFRRDVTIGGDKFGNFEGVLPRAKGRQYYEADIDAMNKPARGPKRLVFSNDGLIYYTEDHYASFTQWKEGRFQ